MSENITTEFVRAELRKEGYAILTPCDDRLDKFMCLCPKGHPWLTQWSYWKSGSRCLRCGIIRNHDSSRLTQKEVSERLAKYGYELLSEYKSANTKIQYRCPCGHEGSMTYGNFRNGKRCPICSQKSGSEKRLRSMEEIRAKYLAHGYEPLFDKPMPGSQKAPCRCLRCGAVNQVTISSIIQGVGGCSSCRYDKVRETRYVNGNVPSSRQQRALCSLFNGVLNYPVGTASQDIAFPDEKLYVEYDGSGHRLSVLKGEKTIDEFEEDEKRRTYKQMRGGWRCIRIVSQKDYLPSETILLSLFREGKNYLDQGHHYFTILIDEGIIRTSEFEKSYDFGILKKLPRMR